MCVCFTLNALKLSDTWLSAGIVSYTCMQPGQESISYQRIHICIQELQGGDTVSADISASGRESGGDLRNHS